MDVSLTDLVAANNDVGSGYRQTAIDALRAKGIAPEQMTGDMLQQMIMEVAGPPPTTSVGRGIDRSMGVTTEELPPPPMQGGAAPPAPMPKPAQVTRAPNANPQVAGAMQGMQDNGMLDALLAIAEQDTQGGGGADAGNGGNGLIDTGTLAKGGGAAALLAAIAAALSPGGRRRIAGMVGSPNVGVPNTPQAAYGGPATAVRSGAPTSAPTPSSRPGPREATAADIDHTQSPQFQEREALMRLMREFNQGKPAVTGPQTRAARRQAGQQKFNEQRRAGK